MNIEPFDFLLARSHLSLNFRESRLFDVFFKLYSIKKRVGKLQKVSPSLAGIVAQLTKDQLVQALEALIRMKVIRRVEGGLVETLKDGTVFHSSFKLEAELGCEILGVIFDKPTNTFYCLDLDYEHWFVGKDLPVTTIMKRFSIKSPAKVKEEFDESSSLIKKALGYYCMKYEASYEIRYRVNQGVFKVIRFILEQLSLRNLDRMIIFKLIDDVFARINKTKYRVTWKMIAEDTEQFIENIIIESKKVGSASSKFYTDANGNLRVKQ